jgi:hypothetical protein
MPSFWAKLAIDGIVLFHFGFVLFVMFGGLLVLKWRRLGWLHLPALAWGILVELNGWLCPLTPLENALRAQAGLEMYRGDFVMHYIMPVLYPAALTRETQILFGLVLILLNIVVYGLLIRRIARPRRRDDRRM